MIILHSMLVVLVILPTITCQLPKYASDESVIDWKDCGKHTDCFCQNDKSELFRQKTPVNKYDKSSGDPEPLPTEIGRCNIGVQSRFFNEESALFKLQIIQKEIEFGSNPMLMIYHGDKQMFGCKFDKNSATTTLFTDRRLLKTYKISLFENLSSCGSGVCICAFRIERLKNLFNELHPDRQKTTVLKLIAAPEKEYKFDSPGRQLYQYHTDLVSRKCDAYSFKDLFSSADYHVLPVIGRDLDTLRCADSHTMRFEKENVDGTNEEGELIGITCDSNDPNVLPAFHYNIKKIEVDANGAAIETSEPLVDPDLYTIYCAAKFGEVCPAPKCTPPNCPTYKAGKKGEKATLECPGKKWVVGDEYLVLKEDAVCKSNTNEKLNEVDFSITLPSGEEKYTKDVNARCFTDFDCVKTSHITIPEEAENSGGVVRCKNSTIEMSIHNYETNQTLGARNFTCERATGVWKNTTSGEMTNQIPAGSYIRCKSEVEPRREQEEGGISDAAVYVLIAVSCVLVFILTCVISSVVTSKLTKPKHKPMVKSKFRKMSREARIKYCKESFSKMLTASTTRSHQIKDGFNELDMLLSMEVEDPDVWELVYPFLTRFLGTIMLEDYHIWSMFSRYLYLQAKKIIDKHGWLCSKPIRKNNHEGLIRTVAISLLSCIIGSPHDQEAKDLLILGFRKLGMKANEQYPHCGVMWRVISHARPTIYKNNTDFNKRRRFQTAQFNSFMKATALKSYRAIPANEVIPAFGTVAEQAAYALGGWQSLTFHTLKRFVLETATEGGTIAKNYVLGLGSSPTRVQAAPLLQTFKMMPTVDPRVLPYLYTLAPESEWNKLFESIIHLAVYYGRHHDAKRLEQRFMPTVKQPSALISRLQMEQYDFLRAILQQLEDIRTWFAAHIDLDDLKQKPVFAFTAQFKEDNRRIVVDCKGDDDNPCSDPKVVPEASSPSSETETRSNADDPNPSAEAQPDPAVKPDKASAPDAAPGAPAAAVPVATPTASPNPVAPPPPKPAT